MWEKTSQIKGEVTESPKEMVRFLIEKTKAIIY